MQYMLLLYADESERARATDAELGALRRARASFFEELAETGRRPSLCALEPTAAATTVRLREGRALLCDGPVAEQREQLLGVLTIEARDLDEAIAIAGRAPEARLGSIEIRPVREVA